MRVLMTTRGSAGHVLPLAPFGHACVRAGHEVLVAAQQQHRANVDRTGLAYIPVPDPLDEDWMTLLAEFSQLGIVAANARMIGEFFARIDTSAAFPELLKIVREFRPDIIVRESWEFASTLVAELEDIPLVRVGLGVGSVEDLSIRLASAGLAPAREALGLPPDPRGDRLRDTPYLTTVPEPLEDPSAAPATLIRRFAPGSDLGATAQPPADWWPGNDDPLVYLTLGSVTPLRHLPYFPALYRAAIEQLAPLRARILVTIGDKRDPDELGALPASVHVERWVPHDAIAPHARVIVCHGGYGTTLGSLYHGVPVVVIPLFSTDQWANADAIARVGAGIALDADRDTRRVLELPGPGALDELRPAVQRLLDDASYGREAARIAGAARSLPQIDAAAEFLADHARSHRDLARAS